MCGSSRLPWTALLAKTPAHLFQDPSRVQSHMCHSRGVCCGAGQELCICLQGDSSTHHWLYYCRVFTNLASSRFALHPYSSETGDEGWVRMLHAAPTPP